MWQFLVQPWGIRDESDNPWVRTNFLLIVTSAWLALTVLRYVSISCLFLPFIYCIEARSFRWRASPSSKRTWLGSPQQLFFFRLTPNKCQTVVRNSILVQKIKVLAFLGALIRPWNTILKCLFPLRNSLIPLQRRTDNIMSRLLFL